MVIGQRPNKPLGDLALPLCSRTITATKSSFSLDRIRSATIKLIMLPKAKGGQSGQVRQGREPQNEIEFIVLLRSVRIIEEVYLD